MDWDQEIDRAIDAVLRRCKCGTAITGRAKRCNPCHAAYMRLNRKSWSELSDLERMKAGARSALKMAVRRGTVVKGPCAICGTDQNIEGHHEDYSKPLEVAWLCRSDHTKVTEEQTEAKCQAAEVFHVEAIDLLSEGRRAKMLRVWEIFEETGRNVLKTSRRFGCSRNTVKLYVRLYEQEKFLESQGNPQL
jgi:hypothetical protein